MINNSFKTYFFSALAFLLILTISLEIYLPIFINKEGKIGMFFFNLIVMIFLHHYCNRDKLRDFELKSTEHTIETKVIFYSQFLVISHLLIFVIISIFFETARDGYFDLVVLLLIQIYLFSRGDEYLKFSDY
jgi:hypothetical protein